MHCKHNFLSLEFDEFKYSPVIFGPLVPDSYEEMTVELKVSTIPDSGLGLFAKRKIKGNEMVAFYNGQHIDGEENFKRHMKMCLEKTQGDQEKCHKNRIRTYLGDVIDLPPWLDDLNIYNATLGHKVNHRFSPGANVKFCNLDHPRFGYIACLYSIKEILEGEELFVDYGYVYGSYLADLAPWYWKLLLLFNDDKTA